MRTKGVAVAVAILFVAGVLAAVRHAPARPGVQPDVVTAAGAAMPPSALPTTAVPIKDDATKLVARLEAFVEKTRGLKYKSRVRVTLLDEAAFVARTQSMLKFDAVDAANNGKVLEALHLVPAQFDYAAGLKSFYSSATLGLYDFRGKELLIRGTETDSPAVRSVLVHELTHALQDQWFGVDRPELAKREDDSELGFTSIVEGDAVRVQQLYVKSLSSKDQKFITREEAKQASSSKASIPDVVKELIYFPYEIGPIFTTRLLADGGRARLDEAFRHPPTTTEQLIHIDRYLAGDGPKEVADPEPGGPPLVHNVLGELGFLVLLSGSTDRTTLFAATRGWGGDKFVSWDEGTRSCVRDHVVMDTPTDAKELADALRSWAAKYPGATVAGTDPIVLTSCT